MRSHCSKLLLALQPAMQFASRHLQATDKDARGVVPEALRALYEALQAKKEAAARRLAELRAAREKAEQDIAEARAKAEVEAASIAAAQQAEATAAAAAASPLASLEVAAREWLEALLGDVPPGALMEVLKDGVVLCKAANACKVAGSTLANLQIQQSTLPFKQMENINAFVTFSQEMKARPAPTLHHPPARQRVATGSRHGRRCRRAS